MSEEKQAEAQGRDLATLANEYGLSTTKARMLIDNFNDVFELADQWERKASQIKVADESDTHLMAAARELRLEIRERRIEVERKRKELKEDALREGRAIDGIANVIKGVIVPIEKYLQEQEDYAKIREAERDAERQRLAEQALREKEEAEREAERKRLAEQAAENERLRKEAAERDAAAEAERKAHEAELAKERAAAERKRKAAEAKARKAAEQKAAKERAEYEAKAKAEAEERERQHQAELKRLATVTCPKCGHDFDSRDHAKHKK